MTQIKTKRLLLRPAKPQDAEPLFAIYSNKSAMKYWDRLPHTHLAETQKLVEGMCRADEDTRYFVVEGDAGVIGNGGFWRDSEVGYILHPDTWGQGIGTELLAALIRFGFEDCKFDHLTAEIDPHNAASQAMLIKAGFSETGREEKTIEIGGIWYNSIYYRLDRPV